MNINKYVAACLMLILCAASMDAKSKNDDEKVRFAYGVDFEFNFDNRELYESSYTGSMTIFGARLTPSVGITIPQHRHNIAGTLRQTWMASGHAARQGVCRTLCFSSGGAA